MSEEQLMEESRELTRFERHKFLLMVGATIIISLILVSIALVLYVKNGTEQLDLSRPGYQALGKEVTKNSQGFNGFDAKGPLDQNVAKEFEALYADESKNVTEADAFSGNPLSKKSLSIDPSRARKSD